MKTIISILGFLVIVGGTFLFAFQIGRVVKSRSIPKSDTQIRNIGETQQQLIDAGYERVYVPEYNDVNTLAVDYKWGPITEAAYCQWSHDKVIVRMKAVAPKLKRSFLVRNAKLQGLEPIGKITRKFGPDNLTH